MRIDAHHHFIEPNRFDYPWLGPEIAALNNDFTISELKPLLNKHQFKASILVQTISSLKESRHFLEIACQDNLVAGVIGWVDLCAEDIGDQISQLKALGPLVGIRHQVHDEADDNWLTRPDVLRGLKILEQEQLPYDLLIKSQHLTVALDVVQQFPSLSFIIDHIAKPNIKQNDFDNTWAEGMKKLANMPHVWCKLSGMTTEADWNTWTKDDLQPYVETVLDYFGPERLIFGSDWPVCLLAGSYSKTIDATESILSDLLSHDEQQRIYGGNAKDCYL